MRKLVRNKVFTVRAMKRHKEMILADTGKNYIICPDAYTDNIPFATWRYWMLERRGNRYLVRKSIPEPS